jgi:hypothetical protein
MRSPAAFLASLALLAAHVPVLAAQLAPGGVVPAAQAVAVRPVFAENRGQFGPDVRFRTALPWPSATVTDEGLVLTMVREDPDAPDERLVGHNVVLRFEGASPSVAQPAGGVEEAVTRCNYFLGNDPSRWLTDVPCWNVVRLADVAPGVSVDIHGRLGLPEYDLRFKPGREVPGGSDHAAVLVSLLARDLDQRLAQP